MTVNKNLLEDVKKYLVYSLCRDEIKKNDTVNIYFENFDRYNLMCIALGKMILAKGMQNKTGGNVISINKMRDRHYDKLCSDFCFNIKIFEEECLPHEIVLSKLYATLIAFFCKSKKKIINIKFRGIYIGDLIYNFIIRSGNKYSIDRISCEKEWDAVKDAILYAMVTERFFKKQKPDYYILDEIGYTNAVMLRMAHKHGAKLIQYFANYNCCFISSEGKKREPNYHSYWYKNIDQLLTYKFPDNWQEKVEKYLDDLFSGREKLNQVAKIVYSGKYVKDREELKRSLDIKNDKKNIIILSHCFSDCTVSSNRAVYADYYEWLEETLKIVTELDNVNWILRPHPLRYLYKEDDRVEKLYEKNKSNNLYWMSDEYSAYEIPLLADAIVTVTGTAGIEYSCLGIPCINTGTPFYSHYGFTINVKSVKQYKDVLAKVHHIKKLSEEQILKAKRVMYAYSRLYRICEDSFMLLANKELQCFDMDRNYLRSNNDYLAAVYEWLQHNEITESYLYQFGYTLGANEIDLQKSEI